MSKFFKKLVLFIIIPLAIGSVLAACENNDNPASAKNDAKKEVREETRQEEIKEDSRQEAADLSGHISIVGSTSVQPLAQLLADAFTDIEPEVVIDVQGVGSSAGIKAVNDGSADIGMASRELNEEEKTWGITEIPIAVDGIAVIVNPNNPVNNLTLEEIAKIYKGEITNISLGYVDDSVKAIWEILTAMYLQKK